MPRTKKIIEDTTNIDETEATNQEILVPLLNTAESVKFEVENTEKVFERTLKKFGVYENKNFLMEVDEDSDLINNFLNTNKAELDRRLSAINEIVNDADTLIFFHEGKQSRTYMSFEAYYSQNGLAPKNLKFNTWAQYYRSFDSSLSDEEIALHKFGDLPYSFVIVESDN